MPRNAAEYGTNDRRHEDWIPEPTPADYAAFDEKLAQFGELRRSVGCPDYEIRADQLNLLYEQWGQDFYERVKDRDGPNAAAYRHVLDHATLDVADSEQYWQLADAAAIRAVVLQYPSGGNPLRPEPGSEYADASDLDDRIIAWVACQQPGQTAQELNYRIASLYLQPESDAALDRAEAHSALAIQAAYSIISDRLSEYEYQNNSPGRLERLSEYIANFTKLAQEPDRSRQDGYQPLIRHEDYDTDRLRLKPPADAALEQWLGDAPHYLSRESEYRRQCRGADLETDLIKQASNYAHTLREQVNNGQYANRPDDQVNYELAVIDYAISIAHPPRHGPEFYRNAAAQPLEHKLSHYNGAAVTLERRAYAQQPGLKPDGFWLTIDGPDDWAAHNGRTQVRDTTVHHRVALHPDANILVINDARQLDQFASQYGIELPPIRYDLASQYSDPESSIPSVDWVKAAADYDGVIFDLWPLPEQDTGYSHDWYRLYDSTSGCIWNTAAITNVAATDL